MRVIARILLLAVMILIVDQGDAWAVAVAAIPRAEITVDNGRCYFTKVTTDPGTYDQYEKQCKPLLVTPTLTVSTPVLFFVGRAWGTANRNEFMWSPSANVNGGGSIPLYRPELECGMETSGSHSGQLSCDVPNKWQFLLNFVASINVSFGGVFFPSGGGPNVQTKEFGVPIGVYLGFEVGAGLWSNGKTTTRITLILAGLIGILPSSDTVGTAFLLGGMPGVAIHY